MVRTQPELEPVAPPARVDGPVRNKENGMVLAARDRDHASSGSERGCAERGHERRLSDDIFVQSRPALAHRVEPPGVDVALVVHRKRMVASAPE
ncbi:hypothetical protein AG1IA_10417 [Rhizoctonia solani AG-1 IA]|uniref:Uncharacterized protein n=1 Tax=Thanatephorus cucumeris (strain AG1-IA) TaxID=983506 RepID=L8WFJ3_THACA|nr:hypothetical protein AG1IA_10417 [Rhizoctonia solani AG-1 IA]